MYSEPTTPKKAKALLTLLLVLCSSGLFAQTEQGKFILSGRTSLDFTYSKRKMEGSSIREDEKVSQDTYNFSVDLGLHYLHARLKRAGTPYTINGPIKEENPFSGTMNDLNILIGFSLYL